MTKLKVLSGKDVCRTLEENGFKKIRQRDTYIVMQKKTSNTTVTVPVPNHKEIKKL